MKKNKFVKLIEHILVALPLLYVGSNVLYSVFNENANMNYSDFEIKNAVEQSTSNPLIVGNEYYLYPSDITNAWSGKTYYSSFSIDWEEFFDMDLTYEVTGFQLYANASYVYLFDEDNTQHIIVFSEHNVTLNDFFALTPHFTYLSGNYNGSSFKLYSYVFAYGKLNQIMQYSMENFNKFGFNKIPFTSFFVNIFHNGETNVYIDFVNNYLNYILFVECVYFVPMILYWFIHLGEYVVDNFTRKGDRL